MEISIAGYTVQIDDEDAERVASRHWTPWKSKGGRVYFLSRSNGETLRLHRVLIGCTRGDGFDVDHVSGDTLDNRKANLRRCTRSQNLYNQRMRMDNRSGLKGVSFSHGKYMARIQVERRRRYLGYYDAPEEAHAAYCTASAKYHREFGRTA